MTALVTRAETEIRLTQLSERWVLLYKLAWGALALTAIGVMAVAAYENVSNPAILALRFVKSAVLITVCAILLQRRKSDPVAALLSLAFLTWTITSGFDFASSDALPVLADRLRFLLFAFALLLFPDGCWRPSWTRGVAGASVAVFLLGIAEGIGIVSTRLFLPMAILCVVAAVLALIARFRSEDSEGWRQQLKWVAFGLVSGIALILVARVGAALSNPSFHFAVLSVVWEGMFQLGIILLALGFLISLLRYRLFDAEAAISRSAALAVLTLALVATFAGTEASIEWVGQQYFGMGIGNVSAAMAAAVAAVLLNPLHDRISAWAEHHFQRDLVGLKRELPALLEDLACTASAKELATSALGRICEAVHATRGVIVVGNAVLASHKPDDDLAPRDSAVHHSNENRFPLQLPMDGAGRASLGLLLLGPRPDGTLYGKDDIEALREVAPALRHALFVALRNDDYRRKIAGFTRQLAEFRGRISILESTR